MERSRSASRRAPWRWPLLIAVLALAVSAGTALLLAVPIQPPAGSAGPDRVPQPDVTAARRSLATGPRLEAARVVATGGVLPVGDVEPPAGFLVPAERPRAVDRGRLAGALAAAARRGRSVTVGVHVRDLATGESVYARHADEPSLLASNSKLFTTAAALDTFGPGHFLETRLLARGRIDDAGVLHGDLAVVGGGDPTFSWRQSLDGDPFAAFRAWAGALAALGVRRVDGDLYLDHGLFDGPRQNPDWDPTKRLRWYQAPVDALAFNENTVRVSAEPAPRAGLPARVWLRPELPELRLSSTVLTAPSWRGNRLLVDLQPGAGEVTVAGAVYLHARDVSMHVSVVDPVGYFGDALATAFAEEGVEVAGRRRPVARLPGLGWVPLAVRRTMLLDVLQITNHESQNLFAETVLKLVGAARCGAGSWPRGTQAVTELARGLGVAGEGLTLHDGSGLSRQNRATPRQVTTFLAAMARQPYRDAYLATLPTGGEAGTSLEERLEEPPYAGHFFAKTGTLTGVSTLSGYARGASGRLYAFSILARGSVWQGRRVQDALVRGLIDHG